MRVKKDTSVSAQINAQSASLVNISFRLKAIYFKRQSTSKTKLRHGHPDLLALHSDVLCYTTLTCERNVYSQAIPSRWRINALENPCDSLTVRHLPGAIVAPYITDRDRSDSQPDLFVNSSSHHGWTHFRKWNVRTPRVNRVFSSLTMLSHLAMPKYFQRTQMPRKLNFIYWSRASLSQFGQVKGWTFSIFVHEAVHSSCWSL